jgi:nicotinamide-nucleotide amidase
MFAEVIAIGDELTSGQRLETNSQWLSLQLAETGIRVLYHTTVADDLDSNIRVFRTALERADVVVSTGGLGPTADDLTRHGIADAVGRPLQLDVQMLAHIAGLFARRARPMPERNKVQALFPEGSWPIPNPHGTAPGIALEVPRLDQCPARLFALPGVPAEMHEMWAQGVLPALRGLAGEHPQLVRHCRLKCFGVGESDVEQMLPDLIQRGRQPSVGITVHRATITLRITAVGDSELACHQAMQPTIDTIQQSLGCLVFGREDDELEHAVVRLLDRHGLTLATAEWGSGGLLAGWLRDVRERCETYRGGFVVNSLDALADVLGVSADQPPAEGATIGPRTTHQMADWVRRRFRTDVGLAVSDFPAADAPSPEFFIGLAVGDQVYVGRRIYGGHPDIRKHRAAKESLDMVRRHLLGEALGKLVHWE